MEPQNSEREDRYRAFIGEENSEVYLEQFRALNAGSRAKFHWPAFLFGMLWLVYRKMYGWAFALLGVSMLIGLIEQLFQLPLPGSGFGVQVAVGFLGFKLYKEHVDSQLDKLRGCRAHELNQAGGSSWTPVLVLMMVLVALMAFGIIDAQAEGDEPRVPAEKQAKEIVTGRTPRSWNDFTPGA